MATTARRLTIDDVAALPEGHPGDRHELIDGELFVTPVPLLQHQILAMKILRALDRHVDERNLGHVFAAPTGVRLGHDNLMIPDICFVSHERSNQLAARWIDGPPDLVVEILSPGTRRRDLTTKRDLYARFKVPEYWIVDPDAKAVTVLSLTEGNYEAVPLSKNDALNSRVLPDLRLSLAAVFAGVS